MGGEDTGVTETTRHVLLESAYFLPASVRRTARALNLPSDASYRFERGVDPGMVLRASERAAQLIREIAGGNPAPRDDRPPASCPRRPRICAALSAMRRTPRGRGAPEEADRVFEVSVCKSEREDERTTWKIPSFGATSTRSGSGRRGREGIRDRPESRAAIGAGSRRIRTRIALMISRSHPATVGRARVLRNSHLGVDAAQTSGQIRPGSGRVAQSVERRSCRAAAEPFAWIAPCWRETFAQAHRACGSSNSGAFSSASRRRDLSWPCSCSATRRARRIGAARRARSWISSISRARSTASARIFSFRRAGERGLAFATEDSRSGARRVRRSTGFRDELGATAPVFVLEIDLPNDQRSAHERAKFHEFGKFPRSPVISR